MFKNKKSLLTIVTPILSIIIIFTVITVTNKLKPENEQSIPAAGNDSTAIGVLASEDENNAPLIFYNVKKGDTLYSISRQYAAGCPEDIAVKTLAKQNKLSNTAKLSEEMTLEIPSEYFASGEIYTTQKGDTLFSIAKSYFGDTNVKSYVEKIKADNFLSSSGIRVGQQLFLTTEELPN